ncbi:hypothetical protein LXL04_038028 [Taraxacum kok-saghyz]
MAVEKSETKFPRFTLFLIADKRVDLWSQIAATESENELQQQHTDIVYLRKPPPPPKRTPTDHRSETSIAVAVCTKYGPKKEKQIRKPKPPLSRARGAPPQNFDKERAYFQEVDSIGLIEESPSPQRKTGILYTPYDSNSNFVHTGVWNLKTPSETYSNKTMHNDGTFFTKRSDKIEKDSEEIEFAIRKLSLNEQQWDPLSALLAGCGQLSPSTFSDVLSQYCNLESIAKVGKCMYGEVFIVGGIVCKVVPFDGDSVVNGEYWYRFLIKGYKDIFWDQIVFWQKFLNEKKRYYLAAKIILTRSILGQWLGGKCGDVQDQSQQLLDLPCVAVLQWLTIGGYFWNFLYWVVRHSCGNLQEHNIESGNWWFKALLWIIKGRGNQWQLGNCFDKDLVSDRTIVWRWLQFEWIKLKIISKLLIEYHKGADMRWQYEEGMYSLVYYFLGAGWDHFCKVFFLIFCKISPNKRPVRMFGSFFKIQK